MKGPADWQLGHALGRTSAPSPASFWVKGPREVPHLPQVKTFSLSLGKTPVRRVTTPVVLTTPPRWVWRMSRMRSTSGYSTMRTKIWLLPLAPRISE